MPIFVVLVPGYGAAAASLVPERHLATVSRALRRLPGVHAELARDRLAELRRLQARGRVLAGRIGRLLAGHPLLGLPGVGPLTAAALVARAGGLRRPVPLTGRVRHAGRCGTHPGEASRQTRRMRLNRGGDRQLNRALHVIAMVQARRHPPARAYIARKMAEGKSRRDAIRCLKRQLVRTVLGLLVEGSQQARAAA